MSIRTLIRIFALSVGSGAGVTPGLARSGTVAATRSELGLLVLSLGYLVLLAGGGDLTRWQLRYHLPGGADQEDLDRLEHILHFLADRTGHFVLEASATGLILEIPEAFDRYVEAQLPRALPEVKLSQPEDNGEGPSAGTFFLCTGSPNSDLLRWATEDRERQVRLHIHQGPHTTLVAQTDGTRPPGRWVRLPLPRLLRRLWYRLPLWDDLSLGVQLSSLFPTNRRRHRLLQPIPTPQPGPASTSTPQTRSPMAVAEPWENPPTVVR